MAGYFASAPLAAADEDSDWTVSTTTPLLSLRAADSVIDDTGSLHALCVHSLDAAGNEADDDDNDETGDAPTKKKFLSSVTISTISTTASSHFSHSTAGSGNSTYLSEAPWTRPAGTDIDAFVVHSVLGKGSFGTVYKVTEKETGRAYAMKVLQKEQLFGDKILRYALTEKSVQSTMSFPFIVGLACTFQTRGELALIMQYCSGGSLDKLLESEGELPEDMSRLYFSEVFLAIEHLHNHKILYRDLKCENVLLDEWGHAMLTDFGLSKENATGTKVTGTFIGSINYVTPEVLASKLHGTPVDIYGLGVLLYEMLTGLPPYYAANQKELLSNIQHAKLELPDSISHQCKLILRELLERDPERRLGAFRTSDIRGHAFFAGVDFEAVLRREATVTLPGRGSNMAGANVLANAKAVNPFKRKLTLRRRHVEGWEFPAPEPRGASCIRIGCLLGRGST